MTVTTGFLRFPFVLPLSKADMKTDSETDIMSPISPSSEAPRIE